MTAPAPVQHTSVAESTTDMHQITLTGVTAGNLLVLCVVNDSAQRGDNPTITDTQSNSWSKAAYADNVGVDASGIFYAEAGSSGDVTVTVTWVGNDRVALALVEVSGQDGTTPLDQANTNLDASGTTHYCAPIGEIDTAADVIVFYTACGLGNFGTVTPPSGSTFIQANSGTWQDNEWCGYLESDSVLTDHRGQWSSSIARTSSNAIASFKAAVGGGGTTITPGVLSIQISTYAPVVTAPNPITVTPAVNSLTITALAPVVTATNPVVVTPDVVSLTVTTLASSVSAPVAVTPSTISLEVTALVPTVATPVVATPSTTGLVVTGYAPTLTSPINTIAPVLTMDDASYSLDLGTWDLQGQTFAQADWAIKDKSDDSVVESGSEFSWPPGGPVMGGGGPGTYPSATYYATVTLYNTVPENGSADSNDAVVSIDTTVTPGVAILTITTLAPDLSLPVVVTPSTATLEVTSYAPTLAVPGVVTPDPAGLEITTYAPDISTPVSVTAGLTGLEITTLAPSVATPVIVTPGTVSTEITAYAPTVAANVSVTPVVTALQITTFAPIVTFDGSVIVDVPVTSLQVTTLAPTVTAIGSVVSTPDTVTLQIQTFEPTVSLPVVATPDLLEVVLTSYNPSIVNPVTVATGTTSLTITTYRPLLGDEDDALILYYYYHLLR